MIRVIVGIILWPLRFVTSVIMSMVVIIVVSYSVVYNTLFNKKEEEELDVDAESSVSDEVDEDADAIRRWLYQDAGLEEIADEVKKGFAKQAFDPVTPFIPFWRRRR